MNEAQKPKYGVDDEGRLYNRETGNVIPDDEPVFILRARDMHATDTLEFYYQQCAVDGHKQAVENWIRQFYEFADTNPDRMREPGSQRQQKGSK